MSTAAENRTAEELRASNKVELVSSDKEGAPLNKTPAGFYGFTFSPASFEAPLFSRNSFLSFEVHQTATDAFILGYLTPEDETKFESASDHADIDLYPAVKEKAAKLIAVPHSRIANSKPLDRARSNRLHLTVRPASS